MCDYCDCRSHPAVAALSADHEVLLDGLARLRRAVAADDAAAGHTLVHRLGEVLDRHTRREERGVFQELAAADVDPSYVASFAAEHDAVDVLVHRAGATGWRDAALRLAVALEAHIAREESDLFPAAHQLLLPSQWDAVDAVHAEDGP